MLYHSKHHPDLIPHLPEKHRRKQQKSLKNAEGGWGVAPGSVALEKDNENA